MGDAFHSLGNSRSLYSLVERMVRAFAVYLVAVNRLCIENNSKYTSGATLPRMLRCS